MPEQGVDGRRPIAPSSGIGWSALAAAAVGLGAWIVLPTITMVFRETYPITDTWVMPAIGVALIDVAAVLNLLAVWRWRQRSFLNIAALVLTTVPGILVSLFVLGEALVAP